MWCLLIGSPERKEWATHSARFGHRETELAVSVCAFVSQLCEWRSHSHSSNTPNYSAHCGIAGDPALRLVGTNFAMITSTNNPIPQCCWR